MKENNLPRPSRGPSVYDNWLASKSRTEGLEAFEFPLFTDAHVVGNAVSIGPYLFLNSVATGRTPMKPALFVRVEVHIDNDLVPMDATDFTTYHGGEITDELAALASLALGRRMKAGTITRRFHDRYGDNRGLPCADEGYGQLTFVQRGGLILPSARLAASLADIEPLRALPTLPPATVVSLLRAARLYQESIWLCEADGAIAWLLMVSAIEAAARDFASDDDPISRLRNAKPDIVETIENKCSDLLAPIAEEFAPTLGATKRFVDFLVRYLPPQPTVRPSQEVSWTNTNLRRIFKTIYDYRSKALHAGIPFPAPMWMPPDKRSGPYDECPSALATSTMGGVWLAKDTPMHFHLFEYIARGAILNWLRAFTAEIH